MVHSMRKKGMCLLAFLGAALTFSAMGLAQESTPATHGLPDAPKPQTQAGAADQPTPGAKPSESYFYRMGVLCGMGASTSPVGTEPTANCGAGMTLIPWPVYVELGVMGPQANRSAVSGYVTVEQDIPLAQTTAKYLPMALVGYSRLFETGNALDYGVALALPRFGKEKDTSDSLRLELRDDWTFANPAQHNVMLRVGWMIAESD